MDIPDDRSTLRFRDETLSTIRPILAPHGYRATLVSETLVRFESDRVYIEASHGAYDYEVAIRFGRLEQQDDFSFILFLRGANPVLAQQIGDGVAFEREDVARLLALLGRALSTDGLPIVRGETDVFERMKSVRWWHFMPEVLRD